LLRIKKLTSDTALIQKTLKIKTRLFIFDLYLQVLKCFSKTLDLQRTEADGILDSLTDVPKLKSKRSTFSACLHYIYLKANHATVFFLKKVFYFFPSKIRNSSL